MYRKKKQESRCSLFMILLKQAKIMYNAVALALKQSVKVFLTLSAVLHKGIKKVLHLIRKNLNYFVKFATIGVFICTIISTIYAVKVSKRAIKTSAEESRPWITPMTINVILGKDGMTMEIIIHNSGKLPAFVKSNTTIKIGGNVLEDKFEGMTSLIMPNQEVGIPCFLPNDLYEEVLSNQKKLTIDLLLEYSDKKADSWEYYTKVKYEFIHPELSSSQNRDIPIEARVYWRIINGDWQ